MTIVAVGKLTKQGNTYTYVPRYGVVLEVKRAIIFNPPEPCGWHVTVLNDLIGAYADHGVRWYRTLKAVKEAYRV